MQKGNTEQIFVKTAKKARDKIWYDVRTATITPRRLGIVKEALWQHMLDEVTVILAEENITIRENMIYTYERKMFPKGAKALFTEHDLAETDYDIDEALEEWAQELREIKEENNTRNSDGSTDK